MKKFSLALVTVLVFYGCAGIKLTSDYDEVIDKGIMEFAEQIQYTSKKYGGYGRNARWYL